MLFGLDWTSTGGFFTSVLVITGLVGGIWRFAKKWQVTAREKVRAQLVEEQQEAQERAQLADLAQRVTVLEKAAERPRR